MSHTCLLMSAHYVLMLRIMAEIRLLMPSWYGWTGYIFIALMVLKILCHRVLRLC